MAIQVKKKVATPAAPAAKSAAPAAPTEEESPAAPASSSGGWFKRGNATVEALKREDKRIEEKQAESGKLWRFWLEHGEKGEVTFVDGPLTAQGILDAFMYREHRVFRNGTWNNHYVCVAEQEPCPLCESGNDATLVGVLTVVDHREYKSKKNKIYKDTTKLFVAKRGTLKLLQNEASKRGGLVGCRFDVSRLADSAPAVGDVFSFTSKEDPAVLRKKYIRTYTDPKTKQEKTVTAFQAPNYEEEIVFRTAAQLREMGFGSGSGVGSESGPKDHAKPATSDVEKEMG